MLVRDADLEWPGAFGARRVFGLEGVAEDDAFGAGWEGISSSVAQELIAAHALRALPDVATWLDAAFTAARRPRMALESTQLDPASLRPNARFVAVGASAVAALVLAFAGRQDLDLGQQVAVISDDPFARQLGASAPVALATGTPATLFGTHELREAHPDELRGWKGALLIASPESDELDRSRADEIALGTFSVRGGA